MTDLFVTDLDGTLLDSDASISPKSRAILRELTDAGVLITLATARSVFSAREILGDIRFPLPIVGGNGTLISDYNTGELLETLSLEPGQTRVIIAEGIAAGLQPVAAQYTGDTPRILYQETANDGMAWCIREREEAGDRRLTRVGDIRALAGEDIVSVTFIGEKKETENLEQRILSLLPDLTVVHYENTYTRGWYWLTFQHPAADKGSGLDLLRRRSGLAEARVTVFGDNHNDLPMFARADHAVAVANAPDDVRAAASEVIGYNHEDAVMRYILDKVRQ